jgi:orotate phosphoribosyltransferase
MPSGSDKSSDRTAGDVMTETSTSAFLELVSGRRGHFRLESGHHSALWLDLDPLFAEPRSIAPFVAALATAVRSHEVALVCGPLVGGAFLAQLIAHEIGVDFCFTERVLDGERGDLYRARYRLPAGLTARVHGRRVAMVDDVMSAGSALRGTCDELKRHGAIPIVAGALLVLGSVGAAYFAERGVAVVVACRATYDLWLPSDCPLCHAGEPLEDVAL